MLQIEKAPRIEEPYSVGDVSSFRVTGRTYPATMIPQNSVFPATMMPVKPATIIPFNVNDEPESVQGESFGFSAAPATIIPAFAAVVLNIKAAVRANTAERLLR